ncbi:MAG: restriction endonuclease [Desulfomonilaceae bacterium]
MKIMRLEHLIDAGGFSKTKEWATVYNHITTAIKSIEWPPDSKSFTLYPQRHGNGVKPIKDACMLHLKSLGWILEKRPDIATLQRPGKIDACYQIGTRYFAVEWETGNISSSHRAVNKMALGIMRKTLIGGILILPTREMYYYLTDRVGNFPELQPYFKLWKSLPIKEGLLAVIVIEQDAISEDVPRILKGTDGRALMYTLMTQAIKRIRYAPASR